MGELDGSLQRVDYGRWLWRVISWDTLLPAFILLIPGAIEQAFPNHPGLIEIAAIALPIMAFLLRVGAGVRQIASNHCGCYTRRLQRVVLVIGVLPLIAVDFLLVGAHLMPPGALAQAGSDWQIWAVLLAIYLTAMVIVMYPGRERIPYMDRVHNA